MDSHALHVLEYDSIREILSRYAASDLGRGACRNLYPSDDVEWVRARQGETSQMKKLMEAGNRMPLAGVRDLRELLEKVGTRQTVFEPSEFLIIGATLSASGTLKQYLAGLDEKEYGCLKPMGERLANYEEILQAIDRCIESEDRLRDTASEKLRGIRFQIRKLEEEIQQKFRAIISTPELRGALEQDKFLTRNGRAVLAVKADYRHRPKGVILDRSNSGATLFIEPYALTKLSNELEDAVSEEKKEIWHILWQLTHQVLEAKKSILMTLKVLGLVDVTSAKAKFSMDFRMSGPEISERRVLRLREARHPLLLEWFSKQKGVSVREVMEDVVPMDVRLGEDFDLMLLTGPNTGGKTVTLKTIGLLALMTQSGLHVPVRPDSQMPVYRHVFADIGDEQSIQQSLSTFSAHVRQIVEILHRANQHSLVLLDELGAGTDPTEGAALGTAILDTLLSKGGHVVVTTHLGQLKTYAYATERVENASVQFDVNTLRPTYQLLIGTPGSSNAIAITKRLGMPRGVLEKAKELLRRHANGSSELINRVQSAREQNEKKRKKLQDLLEQVRGMQVLVGERLERTAAERAQVQEQADQAIDESLRGVRQIVEQYLQKMQNAPKVWHDLAEEMAQAVHQAAAGTTLAQRQAQFTDGLREGDTVYVRAFRSQGQVLKIRRKRQIVVLLMQGKEMEIPFTEVYPVPPEMR